MGIKRLRDGVSNEGIMVCLHRPPGSFPRLGKFVHGIPICVHMGGSLSQIMTIRTIRPPCCNCNAPTSTIPYTKIFLDFLAGVFSAPGGGSILYEYRTL